MLERIIVYAIPEGFESMQMSCTRISVLCRPFAAHHNKVRGIFRDFGYCDRSFGFLDSYFRCASDLIKRIANEPIVARYIRELDLSLDTPHIIDKARGQLKWPAEANRLLANSPYLKEAGFGWKEYLEGIEFELRHEVYSQYAAAFLLNLLPNVENIILPKKCLTTDVTHKLVTAVIRNVRQPRVSCDKPSLGHLTAVTLRTPKTHTLDNLVKLSRAEPFWSLPDVRSLSCWGDKASQHNYESIEFASPIENVSEHLEVVHLMGCCINEVGIADFLKHASRP